MEKEKRKKSCCESRQGQFSLLLYFIAILAGILLRFALVSVYVAGYQHCIVFSQVFPGRERRHVKIFSISIRVLRFSTYQSSKQAFYHFTHIIYLRFASCEALIRPDQKLSL